MKRMIENLIFGIVILALIMGCTSPTETVPEEENTEPFGYLSIYSTPRGALIYIDSLNTNETTSECLSVSVGYHTVELELENYLNWDTTVYVDSGEYVYIHAYLEERNPSGIIGINSNPAGAMVEIDYEITDSLTPVIFTGVPADSYHVKIFLQNYFPWETQFRIAIGERIDFSTTLSSAPFYRIAYSLEDSVFVTGLDGMEPLQFADDLDGYYGGIFWSHDGEYLLYITENGSEILDRNGIEVASLPSFRGGTDISWSHSDQYFVLGSYADGIYRYDMNTLTLTKIFQTDGFRYDHNPVFSLNDSLVAFVNHEYGYHATIWVMEANGDNARQVSTSFSTVHDERLYLSWISDSTLVFKTKVESRRGLYILYFDFHGNGLRSPVRIFPEKIWQLEVSPDLSSFAILTTSSYRKAIKIGQINEWSTHTLVDSTLIYRFCWSPGSEGILYSAWEYTPLRAYHVNWVFLDGAKYSPITTLHISNFISIAP